MKKTMLIGLTLMFVFSATVYAQGEKPIEGIDPNPNDPGSPAGVIEEGDLEEYVHDQNHDHNDSNGNGNGNGNGNTGDVSTENWTTYMHDHYIDITYTYDGFIDRGEKGSMHNGGNIPDTFTYSQSLGYSNSYSMTGGLGSS